MSVPFDRGRPDGEPGRAKAGAMLRGVRLTPEETRRLRADLARVRALRDNMERELATMDRLLDHADALIRNAGEKTCR